MRGSGGTKEKERVGGRRRVCKRNGAGQPQAGTGAHLSTLIYKSLTGSVMPNLKA